MTEDQIKAIAEEYADYYSVPVRTYPHYAELVQEAEDVLTFLSDKYCIVEREKVMSTYETCKAWGESTHSVYVMRDLFGKEMFNQNEE